MNQKLTLDLDEVLITQAKQYARQCGHSVSQLVADYFARLGIDAVHTTQEPIPKAGKITSRLRGSLRGAVLDETDYQRYWAEKYR